MSRIPESAAALMAATKVAERELRDAMSKAEAALTGDAKPVYLALESAINGESRSRQCLYSHLLAHGVKRRVAERIAYGER